MQLNLIGKAVSEKILNIVDDNDDDDERRSMCIL